MRTDDWKLIPGSKNSIRTEIAMADFENKPQDDEYQIEDENFEYEYVDENGNPVDGNVEYEYVEEENAPEESGVEYEYVEEMDETGDGIEDGVEYEYVDENGDPASESALGYEYVDEDGNPITDGSADLAEYGEEVGSADNLDDLPDGMSAEYETAENEGFVSDDYSETLIDDSAVSEDEVLDDETEDEDEGEEKPKSFFGKLGESTPYEVMIWLSFLFLMAGILLMLFEWMGYDMIVYPKYGDFSK